MSSLIGGLKGDPVALKEFWDGIRHLQCPACRGIGIVEAGTGLQDCARCDGDGCVKIGAEPVTVRLSNRLKHFAEWGE